MQDDTGGKIISVAENSIGEAQQTANTSHIENKKIVQPTSKSESPIMAHERKITGKRSPRRHQNSWLKNIHCWFCCKLRKIRAAISKATITISIANLIRSWCYKNYGTAIISDLTQAVGLQANKFILVLWYCWH